MPLYEYACDSCGARFERIQKFSDPLVTECPNCGKPVRKLISSPAIQFKGSGWYVNDYAKSGSSDKPANKPEESTSTKSEPATADKADKTDKADKADKADKPAETAKTDGTKPAGPSTAR